MTPIRWLVLVLLAGFAVSLGVALGSLSWPREGLAQQVHVQAEQLEVQQPVTAVLLIFRAYDTWLELAVLLAAVLAVFVLLRGGGLSERIGTTAAPLLAAFSRLLLPLIFLVAAYILWLGTQDPGGAFQAGVLAAAGLSLLYLSNIGVFGQLRGLRLHFVMVLGFLMPMLLTILSLLRNAPLFSYPTALLAWMFFLECLIAVSISVMLIVLFVGSEPAAYRSKAS